MALIDYHGHRVIAMSILPINERTIVYGSPDGGRKVYADDARMCLYVEYSRLFRLSCRCLIRNML